MLLLGAYLAVILGLGIHGAIRVHSPADFWIAGGRAPAVSTGGSLVATIVGGSSTLGLAGLAFRRGLTGSWWLLVGTVGLAGLLFFLRRLKSRFLYTLPELIRDWYGPVMAKVAGLLVVVAWLGIVGAQAAAAGRILSTFFGGESAYWTLAAGAVFIAYTASGGQVSVIRTDLLQVLLIIGGIGLCTVVGLKASGGFTALSAALPSGHLSFPVSEDFSGIDLVLLLLVVGSTYLVGPDILSRVFSSKNELSARRAIVISIGVIIPVAVLVTVSGMVARVLFPDILPEAALPTLAKQALPSWLGALTMIALLSAFLSSADTTLLTMSAILTVDVFEKKASKDLRGPRLSVLLCGAAALSVGVFSGGIIPSLLLGYSVFAGGLFVPILAGLLGMPLRRTSALAAAVIGGLCALAGKLLGRDLLVACSFAIGIAVFTVDRILAVRGLSTKQKP
ncbi:MAG: sodium:solute symporter family protein [Spirochaetaceae bacterium]|nr:MAG: sodium:solute symporter family protein [Spirochaetaceae bacterium]